MDIIHNRNKLDIDESKKIYECSKCGKLFNWDKNEKSYWYGSWHQLVESPSNVKYYCSFDCATLDIEINNKG